MNTIYITLKRQEMLDDIRQYAYYIGHNATLKDESSRHTIQDATNGQDGGGLAYGGVIIITRIMNLAWARCLNILKDYTDLSATEESNTLTTADYSTTSTTTTTTSTTRSDAATDGTNLDDTYGEPETYRVALRVNGTFTKAQHILLKNLLHKYIVYASVAEWLALTYPEGTAGDFATKAAQAQSEIENVATSLGTKLRIRLHPF